MKLKGDFAKAENGNITFGDELDFDPAELKKVYEN